MEDDAEDGEVVLVLEEEEVVEEPAPTLSLLTEEETGREVDKTED